MIDNQPFGLYHPDFEHDACGIGFVAHMKGIKSHQNIGDALTILENMEHRGASGSEANTGDGAGIMIQIPHEFFFNELLQKGIHLPNSNEYGVGFIFFPSDKSIVTECKEIFARAAEKLGLEIMGYRKVPVNRDTIGPSALSVEPIMEQVFLKKPDHISDPEDFERKLFVLKNYASHTINNTIKKENKENRFPNIAKLCALKLVKRLF